MDKLNINLIKEEDLNSVVMLLTKLQDHSPESYIHSVDVANKSVVLALALSINPEDIKKLYTASLLHDIGKLYVTKDLLHKQNATQDEQNTIRFSHIIGTKAILSQHFDPEFVKLASHHHERLNRTGYPEHLGGRKLDILDRILQVADVTSALSMKRSYKEPFTNEKVCEILDHLVQRGELDKNCVEKAKDLLLYPTKVPTQMGL